MKYPDMADQMIESLKIRKEHYERQINILEDSIKQWEKHL